MAAIEDLLLKLLQKHVSRLPAQVTTGTVTEVDTDSYTCTVERVDRPELFNVRLNATEFNGNRMVTIPAIDSVVLVCMIENDEAEAYLMACSEVEKVLIVVDTTKFELNTSGTLISKGDETLNRILNEMVDQMLKIYAPKDVPGITALKQRINNLLL
ncbi:hypothetical protein BDD43_3389 [Mucilaginibacter gracilis]|uniref:Uncharacterized protein n=1 Tax=Mucilaginibacter gracilis TaxID=423350 RepID=A0A495J2M1_9SPHI|nr:hypothetical protein [Mucilaginibacter gracilis]RKR83187.1 hypothetical protein BDD43_3389 [Mucilaginibacter gracilis]